MANSYTDAAGDGVTDVFNFSFPYLSEDHIEVYIDLGAGAGFEETIAFTITGASQITLDDPTDAPVGSTVRVARNSAREEATPATTYATGRLRSEDMNTDAKQAFYLAQEAYEQGGSTNTTQIQVLDGRADDFEDRITALEALGGFEDPFFTYTISVDEPVAEDGNNGEFWFVREA